MSVYPRMITALVLGLLLLSVSAPSAYADSPQPSLSVSYVVILSQHYSVYSNIAQHVRLIVSGYTNSSTATQISVRFTFGYQNNTLFPQCQAPNCALTQISAHPLINEINMTLPRNAGAFNFTVFGNTQDISFFYRDSATLPYVTVNTNDSAIQAPSAYTLMIRLTPQTQVFSTLPAGGVPIQTTTIGGNQFLVANFPSSELTLTGFRGVFFVVLYQSPFFNWFLVTYVALVVLIVLLSPLLLRKGSGSLQQLRAGVTRVRRALEWFDHKKLLTILILVCVAMVGLALVAGPSPTPRLYLSATPQKVQELAPSIAAAGYTFLTPDQAQDQFNTLSYMGSFRTIVIADYFPSVTSLGLQYSYNIIVLTNDTSKNSYAWTMESLYPKHVTTVSTPVQLENLLAVQKSSYPSNNLGLNIGQETYNAVVAVEGLFALVIPFFALAFFARYLVEYNGGPTSALLQALAYSFFVFMLGELAFIQTGVLLGLPVATHAAISNLESAVGYLGGGGGSRPRLVIAVFGFLFGVVAGRGGNLKFDRVGFLAFLAAFVFLLWDPLTAGQTFYNIAQVALTSESGTTVGTTAYNGLRDSITGIMNLFGNFVSLGYFSQHGAVLYFMAAIPFALYNFLRKSTATLLLLFSAVVSAVGYVRIGDQIPLKAVASVFPGAVLSILVIVVLVCLDRAERILRARVSL